MQKTKRQLKKSKKLKPGSFILIDIWARLAKNKAPFSDITWLAYCGKKAPKEISSIFKKTIGARDNAINFIKFSLKKKKLPIGREIDLSAMKFISEEVHKDAVLHRTGHSIGTLSPHGIPGHLSIKNENSLEKNLGYTIEPGIYLKNKFGMRSEINFYIDERLRINITTKMQTELVIIK
jgi:Xaa-Pro aminopeptidase